MTDKINCLYSLSAKAEKKIWNDCIFVFDTSALLEFYFYSESSIVNLFTKVFRHLDNRLWIPHHVEFEFNKNKGSFIKKPIDEKYKPIKEQSIQTLIDSIKSIKNKITDLHQKTQNKDRHPYFEPNIFKPLFEDVEKLQKSAVDFSNKVDTQINSRISSINKLIEKDLVSENLKRMFKVGNEYTFSKKLNVLSESELRFRNEVPPGYKDVKKDGFQRIGDLIIWYQIIDFAFETKKPIIFVTNDVKEDWCHKSKHSNEVRIDRPREELIGEIFEKAKVTFWMYTFPQFLYVFEKMLNITIEENVLKEAQNAANERFSSSYDMEIVIKEDIRVSMLVNKRKVALKAPNGKYVCTEGRVNILELIADRAVIDIWETFEIIELEENKIALLSYFGKFVNIQPENDSMLIADKVEISSSHIFQLISFDNSIIALRSSNGKFVTTHPETMKLHASSQMLGKNEQFKLIDYKLLQQISGINEPSRR